MTRHWKFGDLEFVVRWETMGERLPMPFITTARSPDLESYEREKHELRTQFERQPDRAIDEMMQVLSRPELRIVVNGWDDGCTDRRLRMLVASGGDYGFVVTQLPGETPLHSAGFTVTEHPTHAMAKAVVGEFPTLGPGRLGDVTLARHDETAQVDYTFGRSAIRDITDTSVSLHTRTLLSAPTSMIGSITIEQGHSVYGPRGIATRSLEWRDVADDGRYVITDSDPPVAVAADTQRFTDLLTARITEITESLRDDRR